MNHAVAHGLKSDFRLELLDLGDQKVQSLDMIGDAVCFLEQEGAIWIMSHEPPLGQTDALHGTGPQTPWQIAIIGKESELHARRSAIDDKDTIHIRHRRFPVRLTSHQRSLRY
jgi:hypothetical protein